MSGGPPAAARTNLSGGPPAAARFFLSPSFLPPLFPFFFSFPLPFPTPSAHPPRPSGPGGRTPPTRGVRRSGGEGGGGAGGGGSTQGHACGCASSPPTPTDSCPAPLSCAPPVPPTLLLQALTSTRPSCRPCLSLPAAGRRRPGGQGARRGAGGGRVVRPAVVSCGQAGALRPAAAPACCGLPWLRGEGVRCGQLS